MATNGMAKYTPAVAWLALKDNHVHHKNSKITAFIPRSTLLA